MKNKPRIWGLLIIAAAVTFAVTALAMGPGGGMGGGGNGGGHGMSGGHMMGNDSYMNSPNYNRPSTPENLQRRDDRELEKLRNEVRERRHELSELFQRQPRDEQLIEQRIDELSRLEAELDRRTAGY